MKFMSKIFLIAGLLCLWLHCCSSLQGAEDFAENVTGLPWGVNVEKALKILGPPARHAKPSRSGVRHYPRRPSESFLVYEPPQAPGHHAKRATYYFRDDHFTAVHYEYHFLPLAETELPATIKELSDQLALNPPQTAEEPKVNYMRPQAEHRSDWLYWRSWHDERTAVSMLGTWHAESCILNLSVWLKDQAYFQKMFPQAGPKETFSPAEWAHIMEAPFQPYPLTGWGTGRGDIKSAENDDSFNWPFSSKALKYEKEMAGLPYEVTYEFDGGKLIKTSYMFRSPGISMAAAQAFCEKIISLLDQLPEARSVILESFDEAPTPPGLRWFCQGQWLYQQTGIQLLGRWDEYRLYFFLNVDIMAQEHPQNAPLIHNVRQTLKGVEKARKKRAQKSGEN